MPLLRHKLGAVSVWPSSRWLGFHLYEWLQLKDRPPENARVSTRCLVLVAMRVCANIRITPSGHNEGFHGRSFGIQEQTYQSC
jgi:hypothetical protein